MALELIALVLLQGKPAILSVDKLTSRIYSYNVEISAFDPQWKFSLNLSLKEEVSSFGGPKSSEFVKYRASSLWMRSRTVESVSSGSSAVLALSKEQLDDLVQTDRSFVLWFLSSGSLLGTDPSFTTSTLQGEVSSGIMIFDRQYVISSEPGFLTAQPKEANRSKRTFSLADRQFPSVSYLVTLDRKWDIEGKTIYADVTISDKGKNRVTLRIQRVPTTP